MNLKRGRSDDYALYFGNKNKLYHLYTVFYILATRTSYIMNYLIQVPLALIIMRLTNAQLTSISKKTPFQCFQPLFMAYTTRNVLVPPLD